MLEYLERRDQVELTEGCHLQSPIDKWVEEMEFHLRLKDVAQETRSATIVYVTDSGRAEGLIDGLRVPRPD